MKLKFKPITDDQLLWLIEAVEIRLEKMPGSETGTELLKQLIDLHVENRLFLLGGAPYKDQCYERAAGN